MSSPGHLTPDELLAVGNDQMLDICALWFYRADDQLAAAFGFRMVIKSPYGGYRTCADQAAINPGLACGSSDHTKGRAIDIDNQRSFRNINESLFVQTLNDNGFFNQQVNGAPFDSEPWHFRNMLTYGPPTEPPPPAQLLEDDEMSVRGLTYYKVSDGDGTNWLVPDDMGSSGAIWRIITEDSSGSGQAEVNGVTAALGYGPAVVSRAKFNEYASTRVGTSTDALGARRWLPLLLLLLAVLVGAAGVVVAVWVALHGAEPVALGVALIAIAAAVGAAAAVLRSSR